MSKSLKFIAFAASAAMASALSAQPASKPAPRSAMPMQHPMAGEDMPFLAKAAQGDMAEVQMGTLVQSKSSAASYKAYGKMLVTDHGAHRTKVVALATQDNVSVPATVNAEQKSAYDEMAAMPGTGFNTAFKQHMIADHQKDIAEYEAQVNNPDAKVAALAKATLPVLKKHLAAAEAL